MRNDSWKSQYLYLMLNYNKLGFRRISDLVTLVRSAADLGSGRPSTGSVPEAGTEAPEHLAAPEGTLNLRLPDSPTSFLAGIPKPTPQERAVDFI